jgi:beta-1,4-mannosyltransferase
VKTFSWCAALFGTYDIFHVHWPENLVRDVRTSKNMAKKVLICLLLLRLWIRSTPVVRTVHNLVPHEPMTRLDRLLYGRLEGQTSAWISLNGTTDIQRSGVLCSIPHGHYRQWYAAREAIDPVPRSVLYFGLVRPYKRVEDLVACFRRMDLPNSTLTVVGAASDPAHRAVLENAISSDSRIVSRFEHIADAELAGLIGRASLVVLPYDVYNSGALLLALSLDRPVLVPRNGVTESLADEVGRQWVLTYEPPLSPEILRLALTASSTVGFGTPDLTSRNWTSIGKRHGDLYQMLYGAGSARD